MNALKTLSLATLLSGGIFLAAPAQAVPVTYDFSVAVSAGPLAGNYSGYFSYDSSIVVPGGSISATNLLTDLSFSFGSTVYTEAQANTGHLAWNAAGDLDGVMFGTNCSAGICSISTGFDQWAFRYFDAYPLMQDFMYSQVGAPTIYSSQPATSITARVPEPASLALMLAGVTGLALARRRQRV